MVIAIGFLFRLSLTILQALLLSALIRKVAWPWGKSVWNNRPTIAFNWN